MQTFLYSTLLFHGLGTLAIMVGMAVNALLPERRTTQYWEMPESADALRAERS